MKPFLFTFLIFFIPLDFIVGQDNFPKLKHSIVRVNALNSKGDVLETGSGAIILITKDRVLILTARHVVDKPLVRNLDVITENGNVIKTEIYGVNEELEFAILKSLPDQVIPRDLSCLTIKKKTAYKPGEKIIVAAFQKDANKLSYHKGNLLNIEDSFARYYLENGYTLREGESGSPLLDDNFNIIGLNHGRTSADINLAIRIDLIKKILDDWGIEYAKPKKPLPVIGSAMTATALGILSLKFHNDSEKYLSRYKTSITEVDIQHYWDISESKRKWGNTTAVLCYAAIAYTGYQLWRNNYIPIAKSPCHVEIGSIGARHYALNSSILYGIELRLFF